MLTLVCCALALIAWPDDRARRRLLGMRPFVRLSWARCGSAVRWLPLPAALGGALVAGLGGACAALVLAVVGARLWRSRREQRHRRDRTSQLSTGLRVLVAELRAGAHPASAAEGAAADGAGVVASVFRNMAVTARLGGDVPALLGDRERWVDLDEPLARIGKAWGLADRHGVALAELLDSVRRDLDHRAAFARDVDARMAGPRATAAVLSGLPGLGLLLGEAVGAAPVAVLVGEVVGQVLLVVGVLLICGGVAWTRRLTEAVVSP